MASLSPWLRNAIEAGSAEIVSEFALPLQARALTLLLNVDASHAEEWISWGFDGLCENDRASIVDAYIDREFERAALRPGNDFFSLLVLASQQERTLSTEDLRDYANLTFASGREPIVRLIAATFGWLADNRDQLGDFSGR